jgi:hypothetical protein
MAKFAIATPKSSLSCGIRPHPATYSDLIPATDSDSNPATHSDPFPATCSDRNPATPAVVAGFADRG